MTQFQVWSFPGLTAALFLAAGVTGHDESAPVPQRFAAEALDGPVGAIVERVVDGDTIDVRASIWLGQTLLVRVRIDGIDAPELEARCAEERRMALAAFDYLMQRLSGKEVKLTRVVYDKYGGRVRAHVMDGKGDIADALLATGLARPYHGERRQSWCVAT